MYCSAGNRSHQLCQCGCGLRTFHRRLRCSTAPALPVQLQLQRRLYRGTLQRRARRRTYRERRTRRRRRPARRDRRRGGTRRGGSGGEHRRTAACTADSFPPLHDAHVCCMQLHDGGTANRAGRVQRLCRHPAPQSVEAKVVAAGHRRGLGARVGADGAREASRTWQRASRRCSPHCRRQPTREPLQRSVASRRAVAFATIPLLTSRLITLP